MSEPFQLDALEQFMLRAATIRGYAVARSYE